MDDGDDPWDKMPKFFFSVLVKGNASGTDTLNPIVVKEWIINEPEFKFDSNKSDLASV